MDRPRWMSVSTASKELDLSPRTICRLIDDGHLIAAKFRGALRVSAKSIDHHAQAQAAIAAPGRPPGAVGLPWPAHQVKCRRIRAAGPLTLLRLVGWIKQIER